MLSALFKAFTGRSGWLGSILALAILAVIAYAAVTGLPGVQQRVLTLSQAYLEDNMAAGDTLMSLQVNGRDVHLGGDIQDPDALKSGLESLSAVRRVVLIGTIPADAGNSADPVPEEAPVQTQVLPTSPEVADANAPGNSAEATAHVVDAVSKLVLQEESAVSSAEDIPQAPAETIQESTPTDDEAEQVSQNIVDSTVSSESSLTLRYDGIRLKLSGHVGDEQMAALLAEAVRRAMPDGHQLESSVLGDGQPSALNWMNAFLQRVSSLPQDAQGVITGSDSQGVEIVPDAEQSLRVQADDVNAERAAEPARLDAVQAQASESVEVSQEQPTVQPQQAQTATVPPAAADSKDPSIIDPSQFIMGLNQRLSARPYFKPGAVWLEEPLKAELVELAAMLQKNPALLLRITGNIDASVGPEYEDRVGMDRAMEVKAFLGEQQVDQSRVFVVPLPRGYAFEKRVQLVFYISE